MGRAREIEDVLANGETLVWEGRPVLYRVTRKRLIYLTLMFLLLTSAPFEVFLLTVPRDGVWSWSVDFWTIRASGSSTRPVWTRKGTIPTTTTGSFVWPNPLLYVGFIAVILGADELLRFARIRSQRFGVTNRRAIFLDRKGGVTAIDRPRIMSVTVQGADVTLEGKGAILTFNGLLDPEAVRYALLEDPNRSV